MGAEVCIYAQVHQPYRLTRYRVFDIGSGRSYFDDETNTAILRRLNPDMKVVEADLARPGEWQREVEQARFVIMLQAQIGGIASL